MSVTVQYVAPLFPYLSLNCLFYVLHHLLFFVRFKFYYLFYFFVTFLHFFILCFVICTVSPYVYYYCSLFLCKSVRTLPQGGNSIAVIKYRIISYRILTYVLVLMYHLQVEQRTSVFKSQMLCEASQGIWHVLLPVDGT